MTSTDDRGILQPILVALVVLMLVVSGIGPLERWTWALEVFPVVLGLPILLATAKKFPFTSLACILLTLHAGILCLGGHYTYAQVPLGLWVQEALGLARNHYDRVGHLAQGFVPAIVAREVLLRCTPLRRGGWLFFLVLSVCLAISAVYEILEWWVAVWWHEGASAFLGTQGDEWDTQWDMMLAGIGAIASQILLARLHDRQLERLIPGRVDDRGA
jgi:putative membrane protein